MTTPPEPLRQALAGLHDSAYRWALFCCGYEEDRAREVVQMVYLEILTGRACFDSRSSLKTWLFGVIRNTARRLAAGARRAREARERLSAEPLQANGADHPDRDIGHRQTRRAVVAAVQALSPQQRQVVELVYYHELSLRQAAEVMGIGVGSASQHFHRAKRALARSLSPVREAFDDD